MVVVTPYEIIPNITANKKYVIEDIRGNMIKIRNDFGELSWQMGIEFIEADVYFSICLLQTFNRILNLSSNPLYSLDK